MYLEGKLNYEIPLPDHQMGKDQRVWQESVLMGVWEAGFLSLLWEIEIGAKSTEGESAIFLTK